MKPSYWDVLWEGRTVLYTLLVILCFQPSAVGCFFAWLIIAAVRHEAR
jgi:hypothetical protein